MSDGEPGDGPTQAVQTATEQAKLAEGERAVAAAREAAAGIFAQTRLCRDCKHARRGIGESWDWAKCARPGLPVNFVTGQRSFPCVIARGYDQLCGFLGLGWERK